MIEAVNTVLVLIEPDEVPEETDGGLLKSEEQLRNERNKVCRGTVRLIGDDVTWSKIGDYVCYYKGATNVIEDDGKEMLLIQKQNILARLNPPK